MLRYPASSWLEFTREARVGGFDRLRLQLLVVGRLESSAGLLHCFRAAFLVVGHPLLVILLLNHWPQLQLF
jgi:hypothetical protein